MKRYNGGETVRSGYYLNPASWSVETVSEDGALPGGTADRFVRVPLPLLLVGAPILGLAFVIFLPFIGFALVGQAATTRIARLVSGAAADVAETMTPAWRPGEAHLTGDKKEVPEEKTAEPKRPDEKLDALENEIDVQRKGGKK